VRLRSAYLALAGLLLAGAGRAQDVVPVRGPLPLPVRSLVTCYERTGRCDVPDLWGVTTCRLLQLEDAAQDWCTRERCWEWGFMPARWNDLRPIMPVRPTSSPSLCGFAYATCTDAQGPP